MLKMKLATKQDLIKIIQVAVANIKKLAAADIDDRTDLQRFRRSAEDQLRSSDQLTMILIATRKE